MIRKFNKKFFIGMGAIAAVATPVAAVISCREKPGGKVTFTNADLKNMFEQGLLNMVKNDEALTKKFLTALKGGYMKEHASDFVDAFLGGGMSGVIEGVLPKNINLPNILSGAFSFMKDMDVNTAYSALKSIATQPLNTIKKADLENVLTILQAQGINTSFISGKMDVIWQLLKTGFKTTSTDKYKGLTDAIKGLLPKAVTTGAIGEIVNPAIQSIFKPIKDQFEKMQREDAAKKPEDQQGLSEVDFKTYYSGFIVQVFTITDSESDLDTLGEQQQLWQYVITKAINELSAKDKIKVDGVKTLIEKIKWIKGTIKKSATYLGTKTSETIDVPAPKFLSENGGILNYKTTKDVQDTFRWIKNSIISLLSNPTFITTFISGMVIPAADPSNTENSSPISRSAANTILDILGNEQIGKFMAMEMSDSAAEGFVSLINTGLTKDTFDTIYSSAMAFLNPQTGITSKLDAYDQISSSSVASVIKALLFGKAI